MARILFAGLGIMGGPMAGHLCKAGHEVTGYNRDARKAQIWAEHYPGAYIADLSQLDLETAEPVNVIISCVGNDADMRVCFDALRRFLRAPDGLWIDHTTISAQFSRVLAQEAASLGLGFVDAPVSGGQKGAQDGQLTIMAGGASQHLELARDITSAYAKSFVAMGEAGSGQLAKMANQICIAGVLQGLSEALFFTQKQGLDPELVLAALSKGAAQSWQMENRWPSMAQNRFDFGFAVDWMCKDLGLVLDEAANQALDLPLTRMVRDFYVELQAMGGGRWDTSSLIARLRARAGSAN